MQDIVTEHCDPALGRRTGHAAVRQWRPLGADAGNRDRRMRRNRPTRVLIIEAALQTNS
jgi:hypothetical protein